ncbi:MAG: AraC family transcriptional regulator [Lachnospiraceae bacterium]|nr:AraC family transcriptional regulator [Lachnospiraceae bacterium]
MAFDIRYRDFTFKHTFSPKPDLSEARFREHYHTTYEILYFVQGDADFMLQHKQYRLRPGSLLIAKPGEYHNIVFHSEQPYDRYVFRFSPLSIYPYIRSQLEKTKSVYYIDRSAIADEFLRMDAHLKEVHEDVQLSLCIGSMNIIIAHLLSAQALIQEADYVDSDLRAIVKYIDRHLPSIHSVDDIAKAVHMSRSAIYKVFSKGFDTPVMSYVRTQKCMFARSLLSEGHSATEVSEQLGFSHYSSFYRDYCQVFQCAPSDTAVSDYYGKTVAYVK